MCVHVVSSSKFIYEVYKGGQRYIVCLERKICNFIPCEHAIVVVKSKNITKIHIFALITTNQLHQQLRMKFQWLLCWIRTINQYQIYFVKNCLATLVQKEDWTTKEKEGKYIEWKDMHKHKHFVHSGQKRHKRRTYIFFSKEDWKTLFWICSYVSDTLFWDYYF